MMIEHKNTNTKPGVVLQLISVKIKWHNWDYKYKWGAFLIIYSSISLSLSLSLNNHHHPLTTLPPSSSPPALRSHNHLRRRHHSPHPRHTTPSSTPPTTIQICKPFKFVFSAYNLHLVLYVCHLLKLTYTPPPKNIYKRLCEKTMR